MYHGDRTVRHNQVRAAFAEAAAAAAQMHPEREKAGLSPPAPQEDGLSILMGVARQICTCQGTRHMDRLP
eukprot:1697752-Amphidinium_carterae.1